MIDDPEGINPLLEARHKTWLQWHEPWPACGPEGNEITAHVVLHATVHDCINLARRIVQYVGLSTIGKDRKHLLDFMEIHWAVISEPPN